MYRYITAIDFRCIPLYALDTVFLYMPVQNVPGTKTLCVKFSRLFCLRDRRYFHHSGHRLAEERIIEQSDDTRRAFHISYKRFVHLTLHMLRHISEGVVARSDLLPPLQKNNYVRRSCHQKLTSKALHRLDKKKK